MSADDVAVERPDVGDQPARDVVDAGALSVDHRVGEVHVGRGLVDEAFAVAVDDELRRHHPLVEHELQPAVGPAHGGEPPRLVEQVGRPADLLPRPDAVAHRRRDCRSSSPSRARAGAAGATPCRGRSQPLARMTPRRAPMRCVRPSRSTTAPTTRPSTSVISSVIGASEPQRDVVLLQRQPHPRHQRLPDGGHPVAEHPRPEHPPDQLDQHGLAAPVLPHLIEQPKILGREPDSLRRQRQRRQQVALLVAERRAGRSRAR